MLAALRCACPMLLLRALLAPHHCTTRCLHFVLPKSALSASLRRARSIHTINASTFAIPASTPSATALLHLLGLGFTDAALLAAKREPERRVCERGAKVWERWISREIARELCSSGVDCRNRQVSERARASVVPGAWGSGRAPTPCLSRDTGRAAVGGPVWPLIWPGRVCSIRMGNSVENSRCPEIGVRGLSVTTEGIWCGVGEGKGKGRKEGYKNSQEQRWRGGEGVGDGGPALWWESGPWDWGGVEGFGAQKWHAQWVALRRENCALLRTVHSGCKGKQSRGKTRRSDDREGEIGAV
ncbi:hypothetical protein FB45DRAFT_1139926 [Roridomyces roridus]|uniref:Uncharacterized protein n=1 Tax=Roridomyces roridus TaxID=1738132 RepID=A0AAD7B0A3_9AGAR|nr:hypothetical protein FB45DRAFT_1139926 [Roridomyces roridus]